jgi:uncharacterized protein (DUF302 family)
MTTQTRTHVHSMTRIDVLTGMPYAEFRAAFEKAAPPVDIEAVRRIAATGGTWDDVLAAAAANAPHDLMVYAVIDADELLSRAGHRTHAVEYLLGNHTIAETMFRHDPKALLYAPLRVLVHSDDDGNAVFTMDQPRTAFGSLGIAAVTDVGAGLDQKVANLLRMIGVDPGAVFD